jgi:hypothetical protein
VRTAHKKSMRRKAIQTIIRCALTVVLFDCKEIPKELDGDRQKLLDLEREFLNNEFALDTAFLSSFMDSTFIDITDDGVKYKQEDLLSIYNNIDRRIKDGIVIDSFKLEDEVVNVYTNSAVVTFIVCTFRHSTDTIIKRRTRFYDVWTKRGADWKLVASQGTLVQKTN